MNRFMNLFWSHRGLSPGEQQGAVERAFPAAVQSPLHWWSAQPPPTSRRLVLGIATYSQYDMRMLDLVEEALVRAEPPRVEVFSVLDCSTQADFEQYVPGSAPVLQTPVVGFWENGVLRESATGAAGRALVARVCGFDPSLTLPKAKIPCATTAADPTNSVP